MAQKGEGLNSPQWQRALLVSYIILLSSLPLCRLVLNAVVPKAPNSWNSNIYEPASISISRFENFCRRPRDVTSHSGVTITKPTTTSHQPDMTKTAAAMRLGFARPLRAHVSRCLQKTTIVIFWVVTGGPQTAPTSAWSPRRQLS